MDSLINCLERFNINNTNFENELDYITNQMTNVNVNETNAEWEKLSQNYLKLKYICDLVNMFPIKSERFYKCMGTFFDYLDTVNQTYLRTIDWYCEEDFINTKCITVQTFLENSLNTADHSVKLKYILCAYEHLVDIAEYYRQEKHREVIDDQEFLDIFNETVY